MSRQRNVGRRAGWVRGMAGVAAAVFVTGLVAGSPALAGADPRAGADPLAGSKVVVRRTEFRVPHVLAASYRDLGYGIGNALADDNLCGLADDILTVSGQRAQFLGADASTPHPAALLGIGQPGLPTLPRPDRALRRRPVGDRTLHPDGDRDRSGVAGGGTRPAVSLRRPPSTTWWKELDSAVTRAVACR